MILAVGHIKGGVGKTMLAINLAIARSGMGGDVLLVNGDEQRTAMQFTNLRAELIGKAGYTAVTLLGSSLRTQVRHLAQKYDDIIIDVGGRDTGSLRAALLVADSVLIPVQPRSFDIWSIGHMSELVSEAKELNPDLVAMSLINAADAQGKDNSDAVEVLNEMEGIGVLPIIIGRRKAFPNAAASGRSVLEYTPKDAKAISELESLVSIIYPSTE